MLSCFKTPLPSELIVYSIAPWVLDIFLRFGSIVKLRHCLNQVIEAILIMTDQFPFFQRSAKSLREVSIFKVSNSVLNDHDNLTSKQFSFRPEMSTGIAFAHFSDTVLNNLDKGSLTGAVFWDLTKACGTSEHRLLIQKKT